MLTGTLAAGAALAATLTLAAPANAVPADKLSVMSSWSQTSASSQNAFLYARAHRSNWSAYNFDWSTDVCSSSPDNPFGFPFANGCIRHDFNYRNYKAMGRFDANKARIDSALYADLKRACNNYGGATKSACLGTAWTYYHAVDIFGVSAADVNPTTGKVINRTAR
jgi:hypothetical protein